MDGVADRPYIADAAWTRRRASDALERLCGLVSGSNSGTKPVLARGASGAAQLAHAAVVPRRQHPPIASAHASARTMKAEIWAEVGDAVAGGPTPKLEAAWATS